MFEYLVDWEEAVDVELLWCEADSISRLAVVGLDVVAEHLGAATGRPGEADEDVDERRLPGPVRAEQAEELPRFYLEGEAVQRPDIAVLLHQSVCLDGECHCLERRRSAR